MNLKIYNPLHQFEIVSLFNINFGSYNFIVNNFTFYSLFLIFLICLIFLLNQKQKLLFFSNIYYFFFIKIYFFLQSVVKQNIFSHPFFIQSFLPLAFSLFIMILFTNIFGLIPFSFT
jgi:F0F1-type ATP synthase membrane subunit a